MKDYIKLLFTASYLGYGVYFYFSNRAADLVWWQQVMDFATAVLAWPLLLIAR